MSANPLVTIIVPSFNQGKFIRRTLDSILTQDYRPIEVIVMDGASTDETVAVLHEYDGRPELQWVSEPDRGVVDAVNKGLARARGDIAGIQSSDDFYQPGAISAAVAALASDPALGFVFGDIAKVDPEGRELSRTKLGEYTLERVLTIRTWIPQPATFFRMALAREVGGWRDAVAYAADMDMWFRMALKAPARKIDKLMSEYTVHEAQRDKHGDRIVRDYTAMIDSLMPQFQALGLGGAARAGALLNASRYQPGASEVKRAMRLWAACAHHPALLRTIPAGALVPGWWKLRGKLSSLRRRASPVQEKA